MTRRLIRFGFALLFAAVLPHAEAALHDITVNSTVGTSNVVQMRMYVPDGVPVVRGILLYGNGASGDDRGKANRAHYQAFADNIGFAIVATARMDRYMRSAAEIGANFNSWAPPGGGGDGRRLLEGLEQLAVLSNHPELLNAPVIFWGFSGAGQMAYEYNAWKPERTIAYSLNKGRYYTTEITSDAARRTPGLLFAGQNDQAVRQQNIEEVYRENKGAPGGALWAYMLEQGKIHEEGDVDHVLLRFFHNMIKLRYPAGQTPVAGPVVLRDVPFETGWLADQTTWQTPNGMTAIAPVGAYAGDPVNPSWLPDRDTAFLFRALSSWSRPISLATSTGAQAFAAGAPVTLVCNTAAFADWTRIEFYNGGTKLGEVAAGNAPELTLSNLPPAVHGFVALGYKSDGTVRTSNPFAVVVRGGPGGPDPIDVWKHTHFGAQAGDVRISGDTADPDGDGLDNLTEFAQGTDPLELTEPPPAERYPVFHHTITASQGTVDGTALGVLPGQVVGIQAGVRGRLSLVNFRGTAEQPIIIVNQGGLVRLSSGSADEAIRIAASEHFQLRGDGDPAIKYGIEVTKATGTCVQITDLSTNFEVCFLHLHHAGYAGIMSKTDPRGDLSANRGVFTQENVSFHDNYIHDVGGEGFYVGSSFYLGTTVGGVTVYPHDIKGARIYNNVTERTGREGIQAGCVIVDCEIYNNVIRDAGTANLDGQNNGLQINPGTTGLLYNNTVIGVKMNGLAVTGLGNNTVFNNTIVDVGGHGIFADNRNSSADPSIGTLPGSFVRVLNNTIVNAGQFGLRTYHDYGPNEFRNNLVVNAAAGLINAPNVELVSSNNLLAASPVGLGFVDPAADDYRIAGASAAIDAGADVSDRGVTRDAGGLARPFGAAFDLGAHEAGALSVVVTATDPSANGATDGSVTVSAIGGTAPYAYAWADGGAGATRSDLGQGYQTVTVTDATGARVVRTVYLLEPPPVVPIVVKARVLPELADANDGSIRLTLSGGVPPFNVTWAHGATGVNPTGLTAGYYTYTVTDDAGTTATDTLYVRDAGTPIYRVNAGGNAEPDRGLAWAQDKEGSLASPYLASSGSLTTGSSTWSSANNFTDAPANLFGNRRYINTSGQPLRYAFPVEPGYYEISLYFNEVMTNYVVGTRVFDVSVEGNLVLDNLDMVAAHGVDQPARYTYVYHVTDGAVNIGIDRVVGSAMISGIAIHRLSGPPSLMAGVQVGNATIVYDGAPKTVAVATFPSNLAVSVTYNGSVTVPRDAGSYDVVATVTEPGYSGSAAGSLVITPAPATLTLGQLEHTYDGSGKTAAATTQPSGLPVVFAYDGQTIAPTNAGSYAVHATIADPNYTGSATGTLTIAKAVAAISIGDLNQVYDGTPKPVVATTTPAGLAVTLSYAGGIAAPTDAGSYPVAATVSDANYSGSATGTLTIGKAGANVVLGGLNQFYDGTPRAIAATTAPAGLAVTTTYDGSATPPVYPGEYDVTATIADANHAGTADGTLAVTTTALVRHAPVINADVEGSVQLISGESVTLNSAAGISGDLLVPGTPNVQLNGQPILAGTLNGPGNAAPANYFITLNSGAFVRYLVRRIDPVTWPVVVAPPAPAGTRNVSINNAGQSAGDFATLRNLTLNSNAGTVAVPPGTYGAFTVNGASTLVLGVAGATEPAIYQLQGLTLNGSARLQLAGPVTLTLAGGVTLNSPVNADGAPAWLTLRIAAGGLTLNSGSSLNGHVIAPSGTVILNGSTLRGSVVSDRLTLNGQAVLIEAAR